MVLSFFSVTLPDDSTGHTQVGCALLRHQVRSRGWLLNRKWRAVGDVATFQATGIIHETDVANEMTNARRFMARTR